MRWLSIDPSTSCSGVACWDGAELRWTDKIKPSTNETIWLGVLGISRASSFVYEGATPGGKGYGTAVMLEHHRGDIRRWCALRGINTETRIGVQEWRTVLGIHGPGREIKGSYARTKAWKAAARECVRLHVLGGKLPALALDGCADEIDAVCIGLAWLRMTEAA